MKYIKTLGKKFLEKKGLLFHYSAMLENKNIAILLRGISYQKNYQHYMADSVSPDIDFRKCFPSFRSNILQCLKGFTGVFITTYATIHSAKLKQKYFPAYLNLKTGDSTSTTGSCLKTGEIIREDLNLLLDEVEEYEKHNNLKFDYFLLTRLDAAFDAPISTLKLNFNKFNFLCPTASSNPANRGLITNDDNFFFFPKKMYAPFRSAVKNLSFKSDVHKNGFHDLCSILPPHSVHFIYPEAHLIAKERPFIIFSREIPDDPKEADSFWNTKRVPS